MRTQTNNLCSLFTTLTNTNLGLTVIQHVKTSIRSICGVNTSRNSISEPSTMTSEEVFRGVEADDTDSILLIESKVDEGLGNPTYLNYRGTAYFMALA